jgi:hypothetical protein
MNPRPSFTLSTGQRNRLWDIYDGYHCAIIGTCLRRGELRKIAGKKIFSLDARASDYQLHSSLVSIAGEKGERSKALHVLLDKKYQAAISRFSRIKTDEALESLWEMDHARGAIAGAFWAIMTHRSASSELVHRIYSHIHMLGHDFLGDHQGHLRLIHELQDKTSIFQEILVSERQQYLQQKREMMEEMTELRLTEKRYGVLVKVNERLHEEKEKLHAAVLQSEELAEMDRLKNQVACLRQFSAAHCGSLDTLTKELRQAEDTIAFLQEENARLLAEKAEHQQKLLILEEALTAGTTAPACAGCTDQQTERCPGPGLCGKKILYVGGLKKMVPHYQQLVENYGGRFFHHDGGVEVTRSLLPKMLGSADIVFCPVDCVSHDACICVKKMCKHYQKPFVMMRSSGLSTLAKELGNIVQ